MAALKGKALTAYENVRDGGRGEPYPAYCNNKTADGEISTKLSDCTNEEEGPCFPAQATVELQDGKTVRMDALQVWVIT